MSIDPFVADARGWIPVNARLATARRMVALSLTRVRQRLQKPGRAGVVLALWYTLFFALLLRFFWGACYAESDGAAQG